MRAGGPPLGSCGRCHRKSWIQREIGTEDRMTQPDGYPCGGTILPTRDHLIQVLHAAKFVIGWPWEEYIDLPPGVLRDVTRLRNMVEGSPDDLPSEYGRLLAERDRLIADGADPADLDMPLAPAPDPHVYTMPDGSTHCRCVASREAEAYAAGRLVGFEEGIDASEPSSDLDRQRALDAMWNANIEGAWGEAIDTIELRVAQFLREYARIGAQ